MFEKDKSFFYNYILYMCIDRPNSKTALLFTLT